MSMSGDVMGLAMIAAMDAVSPGITPADTQDEINSKLATYRISIMKAMCGAIVQHIQTFAVVNSTVAVDSVSLVTPGTGASGPGVGTAAGTIT